MSEKITIKSKTETESRKSDLNEGDIVEFGVSHELKINGDASWVSFKAATKVRPGEHADEASARVNAYVQRSMSKAVEATVSEVERMSS